MNRPSIKTLNLTIILLLPLLLPISVLAQTSAYSSVNIAGSFNGWNTTANPLTLIANNTWQGDLSITNRNFEFKFTTPAWAANWGDNNQPNTNLHISGTGESGGANIKVTNAADNALFRFTINTSTREYTVFLLNNVGTNLLFNGGFETQGSAEYLARHWAQNEPNLHGSRSGPGVDRNSYQDAHSGSWKGVILGLWAGHGGSGSFWQEAPVEAGMPYSASAWIQAESVLWTAAVQVLRLDFYDFDRSTLLASQETNLYDATTSWTLYGMEATAPSRAAWARLTFSVSQAGSNGSLRIDDAQISATALRRTEDFNDWGMASSDACHLRAGWLICTGRTVSTVLLEGSEVPLARSGYAANLANPNAFNNASYLQSTRFDNGIGTISFWYRHGYIDTNSEPDGPVSFEVQVSQLGSSWTTIGSLSNIYNTSYRPFSLFQYITSPRYVRIVHNGGSTNRLLIDDIVIANPEALPRTMDFNTWPTNGETTGCHTYLDWQVCTGRVGEAEALEGKSALVMGSESSNTWLRSPRFSDGIGNISFSYRVTPYSARSAGLTIESSPDGINWTRLDTLSGISSVLWQEYSGPFYQSVSNYVRFRNIPETNLSDIATVRIQEPFNGGSQPPAGWTFNRISQYDSAASSGLLPPSLKFEQTNSFIITPSFLLPTHAQFFTRGNDVGSGSTFTMLGQEGTNWNTLRVWTNPANSRVTNSVVLSTNITALKFVYGKVAGNLAFDDLLVTGPKLYEGSAPPQSIMFDNVTIAAPVEYRLQDFNSWPLKMDFSAGTTQFQNWVLGGPSKVNTNKAFAGQSLQLSRASGSSSYYVDFEGPGETKTTYASGTVALSGLNWDLTDALIGTDANDWKNGIRSVRLRGYGTSAMTMLQDFGGGLGTISFNYRRYGTDSQTSWLVQYSTNAGANWTQIGSAFTAPASTNVQVFSGTVNVSGNVRVRIKEATGSGTSNRRLNIDDILVTGYGGAGAGDASVQSHYFKDGVGSVSFQYRHWMDSAPAAGSVMRARIQTSTNGLSWVTDDTLFISNTVFQAYDLYLFKTNFFYARLLLDDGNSVAMFDDINIARPQFPADVRLLGRHDPELPFTNDVVTLSAETTPLYGARNLSVTSYYRIGTSGAWTALGMTADGSSWTGAGSIPAQPTGTVVQYYMRADFSGPGSILNSPVYYPENTNNPARYGIPRNQRGKVWINEVDYEAFGWETPESSFIELAGEAGVNISGWRVEIRDFSTNTIPVFGDYLMPTLTQIPNDTNGYGFVLLSTTNIASPPRDLILTNSLWARVPGAVRLLNEMGGVEYAVSYGGSASSYLRIPGFDFEEYFPYDYSTNSIILTGIGAIYDHFGWTNSAPTPGAINPGQSFASPGLISPTPSNLVFYYIADSYSPEAQTLTVSNAGITAMDYTLATNASWLAVTPVSVADLAPGSSVVHTVSVATDNLTGNKNGQLVISGDAANSPLSISVELIQTAVGSAILSYGFDESSGLLAINGGSAGASGNLNLTNGIERTLEGGGVSASEGDFALISTGGLCQARSTGTVAAVHSITQFTITGWVKTTATGGVHRLIGNRNGSSGFSLITASNYQNLALVSSSTGTPTGVTSTNGLFATGAWQFFAVTFDAADAGGGALKFYRGGTNNGAFLFSTHGRGGLGSTGLSTGQVAIAGDGLGSFSGHLDDLRFFLGVKDLMTIEAVRRQGTSGSGEVLVPPTITVQPQSTTNNAFTIVSIGVTAEGIPPPQYIWRKGGVPNGLTENSITFNPITLSDAGEYDVIVYNIAGSVTSQVALVVVLAPPEVLYAPTSVVVYAGETVYFNVNATGTPPMLYQWKWGGTNIPGATSAVLILANVQTGQAGLYNVAITNRVTFSNSVSALLTVREMNFYEGGWIRRQTNTPGTVLRWPAISNRWFEVWWSSNLMLGVEGFVPVKTNLPLLSGTNFMTFTDTVYGVEGRGFYQLRSRTGP